ncbi:MAG: radical SAM protein [Asgard group archaeon]|nr:radical SAM protein [Asgard group archaeon]
MEYKFVKDVINALGCQNVLKVDFSPKKTCNFDCIYCIVGRTTKWTMERTEFYPIEEVYSEISHYIDNNGKVEYVILTGSGEPALYSGFGELSDKIKKNYPNVGIMAYTNGTLLNRKDVQAEFAKCDVLGCNLNSVYDEEFKKICRPLDDVRLQDTLNGLKEFSRHFKGVLLFDTKFVKGMNDTERNVQGLIEYLKEVQPNKYAVISRKHKGQELTDDFVSFVKETMKDLPFPVDLYL